MINDYNYFVYYNQLINNDILILQCPNRIGIRNTFLIQLVHGLIHVPIDTSVRCNPSLLN